MTAVASDSVATARRVTKVYGTGITQVVALDEIDLSIERAKLTAIMGPSGSGKSTLMQVLAGLDAVTSGTVTIGDVDITHLDDEERTTMRRRDIGFIFQSFNLVPTLDVIGNVLLPLEFEGIRPGPDLLERVHMLLARLGLGQLARRRPYELSGGQQQRVAIARALVRRPTLVFADEPTGSLDSRTSRDVLQILRDATRNDGQSVVLVTHDPIAASYADRTVFIADGRVAHDIGVADPQTLSSIVLSLDAVGTSA
jgi:putative ABC transport system ATP-binding protein